MKFLNGPAAENRNMCFRILGAGRRVLVSGGCSSIHQLVDGALSAARRPIYLGVVFYHFVKYNFIFSPIIITESFFF
jgi:hypothetical protein